MINGGFFVLDPRALDYVAGDATVWENEPLERWRVRGSFKPSGTPAFGRRWIRA